MASADARHMIPEVEVKNLIENAVLKFLKFTMRGDLQTRCLLLRLTVDIIVKCKDST